MNVLDRLPQLWGQFANFGEMRSSALDALGDRVTALESIDFAGKKGSKIKQKKNCIKGDSCGFSCIRKGLVCRSEMKGKEKSFAKYLYSATGQGILFPIAPLLKVSDKQKGEAKFTRKEIEKQILEQKKDIEKATSQKNPDVNEIARMQRRIKRMRDRVNELKSTEGTGAIPRSSLRGTELEVPAKPKTSKTDVQAQSDKVKASLDRQDVKAKKEADLDRQKQQERKDALDRSNGRATRAEVVANLPDILKPSKSTKSYEDARDGWSTDLAAGVKETRGKKAKTVTGKEYTDYGTDYGIGTQMLGRKEVKTLIHIPTKEVLVQSIPGKVKVGEVAYVASKALPKDLISKLTSSDPAVKSAAQESLKWVRDFVDKRSKGQLLVPPSYTGEG
jgi:hypothetical protein